MKLNLTTCWILFSVLLFEFLRVKLMQLTLMITARLSKNSWWQLIAFDDILSICNQGDVTWSEYYQASFAQAIELLALLDSVEHDHQRDSDYMTETLGIGHWRWLLHFSRSIERQHIAQLLWATLQLKPTLQFYVIYSDSMILLYISLNFLNELSPWMIFTKSFNITRHWT